MATSQVEDLKNELIQVTPSTSSSYRISIVVPVYNEKDNAAPLLQGIVAAMLPLPYKWELLVVDDGSTDGTCEQLNQAAKQLGNFAFLQIRKSKFL